MEITQITKMCLIHADQGLPVAYDSRVFDRDISQVVKNAVADIDWVIQIKTNDHVAAEGSVGAECRKHPIVGGNIAIHHLGPRSNTNAAETFFEIDDLHVLDECVIAIAHDRLLGGIDDGDTLNDLVIGRLTVEATEVNRVTPKTNGTRQETIVRSLADLVILARKNSAPEDLHPRRTSRVPIRRTREIAANIGARRKVDLKTRFQRKGIAQLMQSRRKVKCFFRRLLVVRARGSGLDDKGIGPLHIRRILLGLLCEYGQAAREILIKDQNVFVSCLGGKREVGAIHGVPHGLAE